MCVQRFPLRFALGLRAGGRGVLTLSIGDSGIQISGCSPRILQQLLLRHLPGIEYACWRSCLRPFGAVKILCFSSHLAGLVVAGAGCVSCDVWPPPFVGRGSSREVRARMVASRAESTRSSGSGPASDRSGPSHECYLAQLLGGNILIFLHLRLGGVR